jgi:hypothetical protein
VNVYRLPKITYERRPLWHPFEHDGSGPKGGQKAAKRRPLWHPNNGIMNNEQQHHDEFIMLGTSIPAAPSNASTSSSSFVEGHQKHQSHSAREHPKWPEYAKWCGSQKGKQGKDGRVHDGVPTEKGFRTWLSKQPEKKPRRAQSDLVLGGYADHAKQGPKKTPVILPIPQQSDDEWKKSRAKAKQMAAELRKQLGKSERDDATQKSSP